MTDNLPEAPSSPLNRFSQATKGFSAVDFLENIFFFRWYLLAIFLGIFAIAIVYAALAKPIFSANALVQVQDRKGSSISALNQVDTMGSSPIVGEMEILASRSVIGQAISNLKGNLSVSVDNRLPLIGNFLSSRLGKNVDGLANPVWGDGTSYAWGGEELKILRFSVPEKSEGDPFYLKIGVDNAWTLLNEDGQVLISGSGFLQENSALGGTLTLSIESFKARPNTVFKLISYPLASQVAGIQGGLTLAESRRGSGIIRVTFESTSAEAAASTINAITSAYLQQNIDRRSQEARRSLEFLDQELPRLKAKLQLAEKSLNEFRDEKKTLDVPAEISNILTQATAIEKSRAELMLKRGELSLRYEPDHPSMKAIAMQLAGLNNLNEMINKQISLLPEIQQEFVNKSRDVRVNSELYTSLLNNVQQLQVSKAGTTPSADVVDPAIVPRSAVRPNKTRIVAIGALLGLVIGVAVCQLLALLAGIVHDPKSLESRLGLPVVGILPLSPEQLDLQAESEAVMLLATNPNGQMAESIRSLRTSVIFSLLSKPRSKVILVTSAVPSQGKSFISANFAYALSMLGKKVLLLEADVRRPTIKKYLRVTEEMAGLTGYLTQNKSFEEVVITTEYPNLDLLPAGPKIKNPGDYLASESVAQLIGYAAKSYDYVLIDSPPILPVHDSRVLAQYADITLFIVRQELVSYAEVLEALKILDGGGAQVDGLVYNGFIPSPIRYGYGGYAYVYGYRGREKYGYGRYKYGYSDKLASYSKYFVSDDEPQPEGDLASLNPDQPPLTKAGLFERSLVGINRMRVKMVDWMLRKNRKDDQAD